MRRHASSVIFLCVSVVLWLLLGDRWEANTDEGRYLEGALRCFRGEAIYKDFLAITGPLTYWLCEWSFRLFGVSLESARIPLALGFGAVTASVYSLAVRFLDNRSAAVVAAICLLFQTRYLYFFAVNHRWDSAAFAIAALAAGIGAGSGLRAAAAGASAAAAAWCTPTMGLAAIPIAFAAFRRRQLVAFVLGGAAVSGMCAGRLMLQGGLGAMVECLTWTSTHYSSPNRVAYAWAGTGFSTGLQADGAVEWIVFALVAAWMFLPAILPPATALVWAIQAARARTIALEPAVLVTTALAIFLSTLPRWDLGHLLYVTPVFYVAIAAGLPPSVHRKLMAAFIPVILIVGAPMLIPSGGFKPVKTAFGDVRASGSNIQLLEFALKNVPRDQPLFVFPNTPSLYFFTASRNPTWYPFLEAGLSTPADEQRAIDQLSAHPPERIIYQNVPVELYLKTSPHADPATLRFDRMEPYLRDRYSVSARLPDGRGDFAILQRK